MIELTEEERQYKERQIAWIKSFEAGLNKDPQRAMVFNELCEDGVVRPVSVQPRLITSIKQPDTPIDGSRFGLPTDFAGGTIIFHKGCEIVLFEEMSYVVSALGVSIMAADICAINGIRLGFELEQRNVKYECRAT